MFNIRFNKIAPKGQGAWKRYKVSEKDDAKRIEIVHLAIAEGGFSLAACLSTAVAFIAFLTQSSPIDFLDKFQSIEIAQITMIGVIFLTVYYILMFIYSHKKRAKIISSISSTDAYAQIKSVIGEKADPCVYMIGGYGIRNHEIT